VSHYGLPWLDPEGPINLVVPAAKIHVLQLEPIKAKLGTRWERLSVLVHKLFSRALQRAQGPSDHFMLIGELSYVASFHDRTVEEAALACATIAKEVCSLLFGDDAPDISIRSLVGLVPASLLRSTTDRSEVERLLERRGRENIFNWSPIWQGRDADSNSARSIEGKMPGEWTIKTHRLLYALEKSVGYFPIWNLQKLTSNALFLRPYVSLPQKHCVSARSLLAGSDEDTILTIEMALTRAAAEHARRAHVSGKACAVGVGISYSTVSSFHSRIKYISAIREVWARSECPFLLKIEDVPAGAPLGRLAELVAMFARPNVRILVEFVAGENIPELDIRLNVAGIGCVLPEHCSISRALLTARAVACRAAGQRAFSFIGGLATEQLIRAMQDNHIQFGSGSALDEGRHYTGLESIPDFPLHSGDGAEKCFGSGTQA
jgi:hypothetical protein